MSRGFAWGDGRLSYKLTIGALIPKCMTASPELIDQLAAFHEDAFGWAVACCGADTDAAADALQDAYVKVATGRAAFGGRSSLKTWWLSVVRLTALERRRGQHRWLRAAEIFREWLETFEGQRAGAWRTFCGTGCKSTGGGARAIARAAGRSVAPGFRPGAEFERSGRGDACLGRLRAAALRPGEEKTAHPALRGRNQDRLRPCSVTTTRI